MTSEDIVHDFHRLYLDRGLHANYGRGLHAQTTYHGAEAHKCPLDLWVFQEILWDVKPRLVIELGTYLGGTTLFLADQLESLGAGRVISVDCQALERPPHPRIQYLLGQTSDAHILAAVRQAAGDAAPGPVLVIHDADHRWPQVMDDLRTYSEFVTPGSYLIVEGTSINGHPVLVDWGQGPWEAVEQLLIERPDFEADRSREKYLLTYNPRGYLKRQAYYGVHRSDTAANQAMLIQRFLKALPPSIPKSPVILDLGSYTGEQACEFATTFPLAQIFAFEARPQSAAVVRRTVARFPNIAVIQAAVHDFDGQTVFQAVDQGNPGASSLFVGSAPEVQPIQQTPVTVPALRLDTWAKQVGIDHFDLVWMDLQGAELLALRGMGEMLRTVQALQLEVTYRELYHGQVMWPEIRAFLESQGMQLVDEWPDVSGYFGDAVFVRR